MERVNASGEVFLSHTRLDDRFVLRLAIGNFRTTEDDVRLAWDVLRREARALAGLGGVGARAASPRSVRPCPAGPASGTTRTVPVTSRRASRRPPSARAARSAFVAPDPAQIQVRERSTPGALERDARSARSTGS